MVGKMQLKEHNVVPYHELCGKFETCSRLAFISATGTGKSIVAGKYAEEHFSLWEVEVISPSCAIRDEWTKKLPGCLSITYHALNRCRKIEDGIKFVILDEMHHAGAEKWFAAVIEALEGFEGKVLGLTATPVRFLDDMRDMSQILFGGNVVRGLDVPEAVNQGVLPSFSYITALYSVPKPKRKHYSETTEKLVRKLDVLESRYSVKDILSQYIEAGSSSKACVFVNEIKSVPIIRELISSVFPDAVHEEAHTGMKKAEVAAAKRRFREADGLSFLYVVDMLNEGVHMKGMDTIIMFRKTISPIIYLQQIGRGLSPDLAGKRVKIFDFVANYTNIGDYKRTSSSVLEWIREGISDPEKQIIVHDHALEEIEILNRINALSYSKEELRKAIMEHYATGGYKKVAELFPGVTSAAVSTIAREMGISLKKCVKWTAEEDSLLRKHADASLKELMEILPRHNKGGIAGRRKTLGLKNNNLIEPYEIGPDVVDILASHRDLSSKELHEQYLPGISACKIGKTRRKLGLERLIGKHLWTEERKKLFCKLYAAGGFRAVMAEEEFSSMTCGSITAKAKSFGIDSQTRKFIFEGKEYKSFRAACLEKGVNYKQAVRYSNQGLGMEGALRTMLDKRNGDRALA